uniref:NADH dehydrogenase subunit 5 n=1 Tax=Pinna rudis TaxID=1380992 RepID=UPI001EDDE79A|nr:NADH dehydrogenase subunit 5 [Pinna rudis]BCX41848.1 NADH dehydrogenase subunit 5 [Pinna rudis]
MPFLFAGIFLTFASFTVFWLSWGSEKPLMVIMGVDFMDLCFAGVALGVSVSVIKVIYLMAVSGIVMCTSSFSESYMSGDAHKDRMTDLVFVFVLAMFTVVSAENVFTMVLGWEGLGISSYGLIIYYQDKPALNAGYLTSMSMRVGDLLFIIMVGVLVGVGEFSLVSGLAGMGTVLCVCCMTKSATVPFCAWLPAAMSAPTPVSALVHSSTLVTAGVCFLIESYSCIEGSVGQEILVFGSLVTMVLAGSSALWENDLKKIVALSTMGQVSFMVFTIGIGMPILAFFHMLVHAFIKAGMFISVGVLIHANMGEQDLREFDSGILCAHPLAVGGLISGSLSLMGIPVLSGFYSKEAIVMALNSCSYSICFYTLFYLGAVLTTSYTCRLVISLGVKCKSKMVSGGVPSDCGYTDFPISFLFTLSLFGGVLFWGVAVEGSGWFGSMVLGPEFIFKVMAAAVLFGIFICEAEETGVWGSGLSGWNSDKVGFFYSMWYFGGVSGQPFVEGFKKCSDWMVPGMEYWSEQVAAKGLWDLGSVYFSGIHRPIQTNEVFIPWFFLTGTIFVCCLVGFLMG